MDVAHSSQLQELNILHVRYALHAQKSFAAIAHCTCNIMKGAVVLADQWLAMVELFLQSP
jgi:hypothetical protein